MAIVEQQPPQPPRSMTEDEQDNALYYHEHRLDDLSGTVAKINALIDWATAVKVDIARIGVVLPAPPTKIT